MNVNVAFLKRLLGTGWSVLLLLSCVLGSVALAHGWNERYTASAAALTDMPFALHPRVLLQPVPPATDPFADEVTVTGTLVSADTGDPIAGGHIIILNPGISPTGYAGDPSNPDAVFADGESDLNGRFQVSPPVLRGQSYGVIVVARSYLGKVSENKQFAGPGDPDIIDLGEIRMQSAT